jgi:hypothetical protein
LGRSTDQLLYEQYEFKPPGMRGTAWMEKIMSKTNSERRNVREPRERELRDDELALVSGGNTVKSGWDIKPNKRV